MKKMIVFLALTLIGNSSWAAACAPGDSKWVPAHTEQVDIIEKQIRISVDFSRVETASESEASTKEDQVCDSLSTVAELSECRVETKSLILASLRSKSSFYRLFGYAKVAEGMKSSELNRLMKEQLEALAQSRQDIDSFETEVLEVKIGSQQIKVPGQFIQKCR